MATAVDAECQHVAKHEAGHTVLAVALDWRVKLVRVGAYGCGVVDLWPDFTVDRYRDPQVLPLLAFLMADVQAFKGGQYDGPLPDALPPGGLRVVADVICILLAGFASEAEPATSYRRAKAVEGSDAQQIQVLVERYPALADIRDNLLAWLPAFLTDEMADAVNAIATALLHPSDDARASSLGTEDVERVLAELDQRQMDRAARRLNTHLSAIAYLAEIQARAA
jgi:hypothetical protein